MAPQFLPLETDEKVRLFLPLFGHCNVRYNFTAYFHKYLLSNLFYEFIKLSEEENKKENRTVRYHYWRRGLMLSEESRDSASGETRKPVGVRPSY